MMKNITMKKVIQPLVLIIGFFLVMGILGACQNNSSKLEVVKASGNPNGNIDELYLLKYQDGDFNKKIQGLDQSSAKIPASTLKTGDDFKLSIFHFNDMHNHIADYSSKGDTYQLAQMKKIVDSKKGNNATLFVSGGDDHIGTGFDELVGSTPEEFITSPAYEAYNAAGLDFSTLGNHELDKHSAMLEKMLEVPTFSVVSANVVGSKFDLNYSPAAIAIIDGLKVGVIGLTTTTDAYYKTTTDPTLEGLDPKDVIANIVPAIEKEVDVLVFIDHIGYNKRGDTSEANRYELEQGDAEIASLIRAQTKKPAVVVGGHTHSVLNEETTDNGNVYDDVLVAQAGQYGQYLGEIEISGKIGESVTETAILHLLKEGKPNKNKPDLVLQTEADYDVDFQVKVIDPLKALVDEKMSKEFATVGDIKDVSVESTLTDRYTGESAIANFMNDAVVARSKKDGNNFDFAVMNATAVSGVKTGGVITYQDWYNVMPYADNIVATEMTGQEIKDLVEDNAKRVYRTSEMMPEGTVNPNDFLGRGFIHFSEGIRYKIKLGADSVSNEAVDITLDGKNIDEVLDKKYKVALNSYLSIGRGGWDGKPIGNGLPDTYKGVDLSKVKGKDTGLVYRNQIMEYVLEDAKGLVDESTGAKKDERVLIIK